MDLATLDILITLSGPYMIKNGGTGKTIFIYSHQLSLVICLYKSSLHLVNRITHSRIFVKDVGGRVGGHLLDSHPWQESYLLFHFFHTSLFL